MQIVINKRKVDKIVDAVECVLNMDKKEFNKVLKTLKNPDGELDFSYQYEFDDPYATQELFVISVFLEELDKIDGNRVEKEQKDRIDKLLKTRDEKVLKKQIARDYKIDKNEVEGIFGVLSGDKEFSELVASKEMSNKEKGQRSRRFSFMRFGKNRMLPEGTDSITEYYRDIMEKISCGKYNFNYFIMQRQEYNERFGLIRNRIVAEKDIERYSTVIGENDEPDWQINDELEEYVYKDIPEDLSSEEKSVWIYMKLCKALHYDESRIFKNTDNQINTELLEATKPNSKVICFDFSRIYAKFVNSIPDKDVEAKIVGGQGHFLVELVSKDVIVKAEATSVRANTNEFYKVKMGLPIEGLSTLFDEQGVIASSVERFTPIIYEEIQTMDTYMSMLGKIRADEAGAHDEVDENEFFNKLSSVAKTMEERNINGMEAITGVMKFASLGFFGDNIGKAWVKERIVTDEEEKYKSHVAINKKDETDEFYMLDCEDMKVTRIGRQELVERFISGQYSYKDNKYTIEAIKDELPDSLHRSEEDIEK